MYRFITTIAAERPGFAMTIGSNEPTKLKAFRYARRLWEASAPKYAQARVSLVMVETSRQVDVRLIRAAREHDCQFN